MPITKLSPETKRIEERIIEMRRDIHKHPELGLEEVRTQGLIERRLDELKIPHRRCGKTGIIGLLKGKMTRPVLLIRADMDCLPIQEENKVPYRSVYPGRMHACGHDCHVAMLLGAAELLEKEPPKSTIKLTFQPAEEGRGGANLMLAEGVLDDPRPDNALSFHVWRELPVGTIGVITGAAMASVDEFRITVIGSGGHAAYPHLTVDPIPIAAEIIGALQKVVSRSTDPQDPVVVTVATIHSGTAFNIIPEKVEMSGTVRTMSDLVRTNTEKRIREIASEVARANGAKARVKYLRMVSPTINDAEFSQFVWNVAEEVVGKKNVTAPRPSMGGEDFSEFLTKVPGCYFFIGIRNEDKGLVNPHHSSKFDVDESALAIGTEVITRIAREYHKYK